MALDMEKVQEGLSNLSYEEQVLAVSVFPNFVDRGVNWVLLPTMTEDMKNLLLGLPKKLVRVHELPVGCIVEVNPKWVGNVAKECGLPVGDIMKMHKDNYQLVEDYFTNLDKEEGFVLLWSTSPYDDIDLGGGDIPAFRVSSESIRKHAAGVGISLSEVSEAGLTESCDGVLMLFYKTDKDYGEVTDDDERMLDDVRDRVRESLDAGEAFFKRVDAEADRLKTEADESEVEESSEGIAEDEESEGVVAEADTVEGEVAEADESEGVVGEADESEGVVGEADESEGVVGEADTVEGEDEPNPFASVSEDTTEVEDEPNPFASVSEDTAVGVFNASPTTFKDSPFVSSSEEDVVNPFTTSVDEEDVAVNPFATSTEEVSNPFTTSFEDEEVVNPFSTSAGDEDEVANPFVTSPEEAEEVVNPFSPSLEETKEEVTNPFSPSLEETKEEVTNPFAASSEEPLPGICGESVNPFASVVEWNTEGKRDLSGWVSGLSEDDYLEF